MAHNAYLTSPVARGGTTTQWPTGGTVYSQDFAWFAVTCFQSINGDLGGTWVPSSQIVIGGSAGLGVLGPLHTGSLTTIGFTNTDTMVVNAFATYVSGWQANGTSAFHKDVTFDAGTFGSATVVSDSHVAWTINGTFTVATTAQLNGGAAISSDVVIGGSATSFTIGLLVVTTLNGTLKCSGAGARTYRRHYAGDASYTMTSASLFELLEFFCTTGGRICTLPSPTTVPDGFRVNVRNGSGSQELQLIDADSTNYGYFGGAADNNWVQLQSDVSGSAWNVVAGGKYVADMTP
jgi:hypothetical protein